jgi:hypothetical protein
LRIHICCPLKNDFADVIVSSSCFEHSEFFWLLFNESLRILKPNGLLSDSEDIVHYRDFFHGENFFTSKAHFFIGLKKVIRKPLKNIISKLKAIGKKE